MCSIVEWAEKDKYMPWWATLSKEDCDRLHPEQVKPATSTYVETPLWQD